MLNPNQNESDEKRSTSKNLSQSWVAPKNIVYGGPGDEETHKLRIFVENSKLFELDKELVRRKKVLGNIDKKASALGGRIRICNSILHASYIPNVDIDAVYLAPKDTTIEDLFQLLLVKFRGKATFFHDSSTPFITIDSDGITVSLMFACLGIDKIPESFDYDKFNRNGLDPMSIRSCIEIERCKEVYAPTENFHLYIRCLNLWAKQRGMYTSSWVYNSRYSWANFIASGYRPHENLLQNINDHYRSVINFGFYQEYPDFVNHSLCSQNPTLDHRLKRRWTVFEFKRALQITKLILERKATLDELFEKPRFFSEFDDFLILFVQSELGEHHVKLCELVESKMYRLLDDLERPRRRVQLVHINPKRFERQNQQRNKFNSNTFGTSRSCSMWFIAAEFHKRRNWKVDATNDVRRFVSAVHEVTSNANLHTGRKVTIKVRRISKHYLGLYLSEDVLNQEEKNANRQINELSKLLDDSVDECIYDISFRT